MTTLTVKMPEGLSLRLRNEAKGRGTTCSTLARRAIENMLNSSSQPSSGNCLEIACDLAGKLDCVDDLATNPEHMKGFGQ